MKVRIPNDAQLDQRGAHWLQMQRRQTHLSLRIASNAMGLFLAKLTEFLKDWFASRSRILLLGLDAAGKTTILYKLKFNETISTIPTIGFNVAHMRVADLMFMVWDVGGQAKVRDFWPHHFQTPTASSSSWIAPIVSV